jgi:O-antigen/teichoic acid export membrane protein
LGQNGITFLIFIVCAKLLTPYEFGIYNYILSIIFLLIIFGDFGISTATSKYVAEYNLTNKEKLKGVLFSSGMIIFGLTTLITILTLIFGPSYLKDKYVYVLYLLPSIFLAPMISLYDGIYRGLKRFKSLSIISLITGALSLSFIYFFIKNYGLIGALIAQNLFYFLLFLVLVIGYKEFHLKVNGEVMREIGKYSLLVGLSTVGYFLYTRIDILILGHFGFIEEISYYEIINKIFMLILIPVTVLGTIVAPNSTKNFILRKFKYIKKKMIKESITLFIMGLVVALMSFLIFPIIFRTFLNEYDSTLLIRLLNMLLILIPLRFFSTYISMGYITPSGKVGIVTRYLIIFGIINVILDVILINIMGFIGVIYATLVSQILFIVFKDFVSFIPEVFKNAKR